MHATRHDWVQIFDGGDELAPLIGGDMCGYDAPDEIISSSNQILIKFHTDDHDTGSGYRIKIEKGTYQFKYNTNPE